MGENNVACPFCFGHGVVIGYGNYVSMVSVIPEYCRHYETKDIRKRYINSECPLCRGCGAVNDALAVAWHLWSIDNEFLTRGMILHFRKTVLQDKCLELVYEHGEVP